MTYLNVDIRKALEEDLEEASDGLNYLKAEGKVWFSAEEISSAEQAICAITEALNSL